MERVGQFVQRNAAAGISLRLVLGSQGLQTQNGDGVRLDWVLVAAEQARLVTAVENGDGTASPAVSHCEMLVPFDPDGDGLQILNFVGRQDVFDDDQFTFECLKRLTFKLAVAILLQDLVAEVQKETATKLSFLYPAGESSFFLGPFGVVPVCPETNAAVNMTNASAMRVFMVA